jgi:hypothetical protein
MITLQPSTPRPLDSWLVETVRLTVFPSAEATVNAESWWKALFGKEASSTQRTPFARQEQGDWEGGVLSLAVHPGRIDWVLAPKIAADELPSTFPTIGRLVEILPKFLDEMLRWIPSSPAMDRLALGVGAFQPVTDHAEGYTVLAALLPFVQVDPSSSDFRYQINRPQASKLGIENLRINRLAAWWIVKMQLLVSSPGTASVRRSAPLYACRVDVDVNTIEDFGEPLPAERVPDLLRELLEISTDLVAKGDRR